MPKPVQPSHSPAPNDSLETSPTIRNYSGSTHNAKPRHRPELYTDCPLCGRPALKDTVLKYGQCSKCRGPLPHTPQPNPRLRKEILAKQTAWLDYLQQQFPSNKVVVQHRKGHKRHGWRSAPCCGRDRVYHRVLLQNEVLFDIDVADWKEVSKRLCTSMDELRIPYLLAWSGGKGPHIHVFLATGGFHLGIDEWRWVRWCLVHTVLDRTGLDVSVVDGRPIGGRNYTLKEFGCFRQNRRVKTLVTDCDDLVLVAEDDITLTLKVPDKIQTFGFFASKKEREAEKLHKLHSKLHNSDSKSLSPPSFETTPEARLQGSEQNNRMPTSAGNLTFTRIKQVLSDKPEFDQEALYVGVVAALEHARRATEFLPYSHMFREGKADKWLASVIAPEVNHLARGNLIVYLWKEIREANPDKNYVAWFEELLAVVEGWQRAAQQLAWKEPSPYRASNFNGHYGWADYDPQVTRVQAYSLLKSKGFIRHSTERSLKEPDILDQLPPYKEGDSTGN